MAADGLIARLVEAKVVSRKRQPRNSPHVPPADMTTGVWYRVPWYKRSHLLASPWAADAACGRPLRGKAVSGAWGRDWVAMGPWWCVEEGRKESGGNRCGECRRVAVRAGV